MLKLMKPFTLCCVAALLTACAGKVTYQTLPVTVVNSTSHQLAHSDVLNQTNHTFKPLTDDHEVMYSQNFGGGGVGVGLLLGPIGVMANVAAIESNTDEDIAALKGKWNVQPSALFSKAAANSGLALDANAVGSVKLTPYAYISKTENEQLYLAAAMIVETNPGQKDNWVGRYMYQTNVKISKAELVDGVSAAENQRFTAELQQGFAEVIKLYQDDKAGKLASTQSVEIESDFLTPRFLIPLLAQQLPSTNSRQNFRLPLGVFSLNDQALKVTVKKQ
jgi:hypothetical protein